MSRRTVLRVWIDLANSPHVLFFQPVIEEIESRGHRVLITARDFAQTLALLERTGLEYVVIGSHGGRGLLAKSGAIIGRARGLFSWAREKQIDLAIHHNSYAQALAAYTARVPSVALMDYEHQPANHLSFGLATKVMMPAVIPDSALKKYHMGRKLVRYDGLKEDVYLHTLAARADMSSVTALGVPREAVLVLFRPEPSMAAYHRFTNPVCNELLDYLAEKPGVVTLVVPRTFEQALSLSGRANENVRILTSPVDGAALLLRADLVVTAGGTMAREGAVLGTPAYSLFAGRRAAIDEHLAGEGRLVEIRDRGDFASISLRKKPPTTLHPERASALTELLVDEMLATAHG